MVMTLPGHPPRKHPDGNGPTWRALAIVSLALLVVTAVAIAAFASVPLRSVTRSGTAWTSEELPVNYTGPWITFNVDGGIPVIANISLPAGANATSIVAQFGTVGGWWLNLSVGGKCAFRPCTPAPGPAVPPGNWLIYSVSDASSGDFGWSCEVHWTCSGPWTWMRSSGSSTEAWTLTWEVGYNYTATEPFL